MGRRKIEFTETQIEEIERMAGLGLTEAQIAAILGVSWRTLHRRKNGEGLVIRTEVASALQRGKARAENDVAKALIERAKTGDVAAIRWYEMTRAGRTEKQRIGFDSIPPFQIMLTNDGDTAETDPDHTQPDSD